MDQSGFRVLTSRRFFPAINSKCLFVNHRSALICFRASSIEVLFQRKHFFGSRGFFPFDFVMSATEEVQNAPVEQPQPEPEAPVAAEKPVKEKAAKAPKEKKPRAPRTASHPPYFEMIKEALQALNEKSGSSPYAIAKYMEEKHKAVLPANFRKILGLQLKNSATRGKLIKIKASYKLSEAAVKKDAPVKKPVAKAKAKANSNAEKKKSQPKRTAATKTTRALRTTRASKKTEANKIAPTKPAKKPMQSKKRSAPAKAKQPKSIRSPAAKKAKKAAAV